MRLQAACLILFVGILCIQLRAQNAGDPLSGIWTGDWGPSPIDRNKVTVELKWDGKIVTGAVTGTGNVAGPNTAVFSYSIPFKKTSFDPKTSILRLEADAFFQGYKVRYVIDGQLQDRTLVGTWKHGDKKGNFRLLRN